MSFMNMYIGCRFNKSTHFFNVDLAQALLFNQVGLHLTPIKICHCALRVYDYM